MAKKFIVIKSASPIEYKIADVPPAPAPKEPGAPAPTGDLLVLKAESEADIKLTKYSVVIEEV